MIIIYILFYFLVLLFLVLDWPILDFLFTIEYIRMNPDLVVLVTQLISVEVPQEFWLELMF